jgi:hypothetical protein
MEPPKVMMPYGSASMDETAFSIALMVAAVATLLKILAVEWVHLREFMKRIWPQARLTGSTTALAPQPTYSRTPSQPLQSVVIIIRSHFGRAFTDAELNTLMRLDELLKRAIAASNTGVYGGCLNDRTEFKIYVFGTEPARIIQTVLPLLQMFCTCFHYASVSLI